MTTSTPACRRLLTVWPTTAGVGRGTLAAVRSPGQRTWLASGFETAAATQVGHGVPFTRSAARRSRRHGSRDGGTRTRLLFPRRQVRRFAFLSRRDKHARAYLRTHVHARNREAAGERQKAEKRLMMAGHAEQKRGGVARGVSRIRNLSIAALRSKSSQRGTLIH